MTLENEILAANQRELTKIRTECEQLRSMQDDITALRSDNRRYLDQVFYFVFAFHPKVQPKLVLDTNFGETTTGLLSLQ